MSIPAKCTKCGRGLSLECDPDCPPIRIELWLKIVVCNRCGEYLEKRRAILDSTQAICNGISQLIGTKAHGDACAKSADALTKLTQSFVALLVRRWNTRNDWDLEMVNMITSHPSSAMKSLVAHERSHRMAREKADRDAAERLHAGE
jgi:hypothetical protein